MVVHGGNMKPYLDLRLKKNCFIRVFFPWVKGRDLVWHRDNSDRDIVPLLNSNWMFQFDNDLPFLLKEELFIKKSRYHRLLKGNGFLVLKIKE